MRIEAASSSEVGILDKFLTAAMTLSPLDNAYWANARPKPELAPVISQTREDVDIDGSCNLGACLEGQAAFVVFL
jgi:hypothetical protein